MLLDTLSTFSSLLGFRCSQGPESIGRELLLTGASVSVWNRKPYLRASVSAVCSRSYHCRSPHPVKETVTDMRRRKKHPFCVTFGQVSSSSDKLGAVFTRVVFRSWFLFLVFVYVFFFFFFVFFAVTILPCIKAKKKFGGQLSVFGQQAKEMKPKQAVWCPHFCFVFWFFLFFLLLQVASCAAGRIKGQKFSTCKGGEA